jgi:DNA-binding CsgD family transcriptional regulator
MENLRTFLKNGYQIKGIICHETGKNGTRKYFLNDVIGVVEDGHLVRVWGMQQDITEERSKIESEKELLEQLTSEQSQILKMTIDGKTMKEIAAETGLSFKTVEFQRNRLRNVFKVDTIAQLIAAAIQLGVQTIEI